MYQSPEQSVTRPNNNHSLLSELSKVIPNHEAEMILMDLRELTEKEILQLKADDKQIVSSAERVGMNYGYYPDSHSNALRKIQETLVQLLQTETRGKIQTLSTA